MKRKYCDRTFGCNVSLSEKEHMWYTITAYDEGLALTCRYHKRTSVKYVKTVFLFQNATEIKEWLSQIRLMAANKEEDQQKYGCRPDPEWVIFKSMEITIDMRGAKLRSCDVLCRIYDYSDERGSIPFFINEEAEGMVNLLFSTNEGDCRIGTFKSVALLHKWITDILRMTHECDWYHKNPSDNNRISRVHLPPEDRW